MEKRSQNVVELFQSSYKVIRDDPIRVHLVAAGNGFEILNRSVSLTIYNHREIYAFAIEKISY